MFKMFNRLLSAIIAWLENQGEIGQLRIDLREAQWEIKRREDVIRILAERFAAVDATGAIRQVEVEVLQGMLDHMAAQAMIDPLTGLARLGVAESMFVTLVSDRLRTQTRRTTSGDFITAPVPVSAVFIDLDGFKVINDRCGHAAGDRVLAAFAALLRETFKRPGDIATRKGGDEFVVLSMGTPQSVLVTMLQEFLERCSEAAGLTATTTEGGEVLRVSASIGVATDEIKTTEGLGAAIAKLIDAADATMYMAKRRGMNQVVAV